MKLFSVGKIGVALDGIVHKLEKRKHGDVKVIECKCRVQPFTAQHALAIDEIVKSALFKRTTGDPHPHVKEFVFLLPIERQNITIFATPDTEEASILFDQVKISNLRARTEKGAGGYVLTFSATFSQDNSQLAYAEKWRTEMRFISCEEAEPSLDFADDEPAGDEEESAPVIPQPMFDDEGRELQEAGAGDRAQHKPLSHANGRKRKTH